MARPQKTIKVKEPIRIRERKLANGNISLYLDIYVKGTRKVESLNLYLVPEIDKDSRARNAITRQQAEKVKSDRILALQSHGIKQWDKVKKSCISLVDFLKQYETESFGFTESTLKGRRDMRKKIEEHLADICRPDFGLAEVDVEFCRGFLDFLQNAKHGVSKEKGKTISNGCAHHHQAVLNGELNKAVREGYIKSNPLKSIPSKEKYQPTESEREYLTMDEVKILMNTDCPHTEVKRAFLLSVFTGLRLSDIRTLTWAKMLNAPDGVTKLIRTKMQKTQKYINLPLSVEAMSCLNKKDDPNELIYTLPAGTSNIERNIKKWLEAAGIEKHITFHCARHTFATMMLTLGADLFTTSKLMGHTNVQTTSIYAKIVDQKKVETVNLVDSFFGK